jgi:ribose transport system substrate-binding protein
MESGAAAPVVPEGAEVWLGNSIRSLSNPYHAAWDQGGQLFAEAKGLSDNYQVLLSEGDNTNHLDDIKALIAKGGKDVVFNVDPNENSNAVPIAEIMEEAGVYWVSQWNKPPDAHPRDYKYWIAHMAADDYQMGYDNAKLMFEELGGEGKVVHIQGMLGNAAAQGREDGFRAAAAEYPGIEILDVQTADWDQTKAQNLVETWLVKFPEIDAIHTAGDMHALGALAAIKAGRPEEVGKILISGVSGDEATTKAILAGEIFSTSGVPAHWQGGMGLSIPYAAYLGLFDPEALSPEQQEFYFDTVLITKENAQQWLEDNILGEPQIDWDDWWGNILRPME